jgi:hypothetical protein
MRNTREKTFRQLVDQLIATMSEGFNWGTSRGPARDENLAKLFLADLFRACCKIGELPIEDRGKFATFGGASVTNTPEALYRLLFLLNPPSVNFSNMYKSRLFTFSSRDDRFWVDVHLFKYELGLYFSARKESVIGQGRDFFAGHPGADNGWSLSDEEGQKFFEMVKMAANYEWIIYSGNDFKV